MKVIKSLVEALWPIVRNQLEKLSKKTETPWDDLAVNAADLVITQWLNWDEDENDSIDLNLR
jgi:hypothetical protein